MTMPADEDRPPSRPAPVSLAPIGPKLTAALWALRLAAAALTAMVVWVFVAGLSHPPSLP